MADANTNSIFVMNETVEEAFKVLRANINFCDPENKYKTISITSYSPDEGKSFTSTNLSVSMAKSGLKILYIDADIRKPMLFKSLVSKDFKGLSNYLMGHAELNEIINKTEIEGFHFISCGIKTHNPGELICSPKLGELLDAVKVKYNFVIIDTPPLGSVIDGALIASITDASIIVISQNKVKLRNAIMMKDQLEKANANIIGAILNKVSKLDYKNYYGGYDYYGSKGKKISKLLKKQLIKKRDQV